MVNFKIDLSHIVRGPNKDVEKFPDTDIYSFMFHREEVGNFPPAQNPDRVAFIDAPSGQQITFRQLKNRIEILSRGFKKALNLKAGDVVCFHMPNDMDYPTALWAALRLGVIPSCANPIYTPHELVHQLKLSRSQFILTHPLYIKTAITAAKEVGIPESNILLVSNADNLPFLSIPDILQIGESAPEIVPLRLTRGESKRKVALLNFSSGTSGLAKGVLITHANVISNVCQFYIHEGAGRGNWEGTANGCLPFFHIYGLVCIMHCQLSDGRAVVIQPSFSPETFVNDIHKYKINRLYVVPPILLALYHRVPHSKLQFNPPLDSICCAAAPLPKDLVPHLQKIWPSTLLRQGWGMTETATGITITPSGSPKGFSHSCGPVVPNAECVIVDTETLTSIAPGQGQGELWVRSPSVTLGYIDNPSETDGMFNIGGEGWMRSGDEVEFERGTVAANGTIQEAWLLCIRDRLKELIKVQGNQVAPAELENILASHPCVADQCVVGKPDDRKGEVPWAFIVKKNEVSKDEIMKWVQERTSKHKHLGGVEFVEQIVKNASGKVLKRVYRDQFKKEKQGVIKARL